MMEVDEERREKKEREHQATGSMASTKEDQQRSRLSHLSE